MKFIVFPTIIGYLKLSYQNEVVYSLSKVDDENSSGEQTNFTQCCIKQIQEYFTGKRKYFDLKIHLEGTEFQTKVWKQLLKIPYGKTITYRELAKRIGNEKACRAVGNANNQNKIAIIIPCHRVISSSGRLSGFAGGQKMKKELLEIEGHCFERDKLI